MIYVLDAHALIWFVARDARLGRTAAAAIRDRSARLVVPTIALAEIGHNHATRPTQTPLARVRAFISATTNTVIHPFDVAVLDRIPSGFEIHDAIIVATALVYRDSGAEPVRLLTNDDQITRGGLVDVLS